AINFINPLNYLSIWLYLSHSAKMFKNLSQKRQRITISEYLKQEICEYCENNLNKTQVDIAKHFNSQDSSLNLNRTTIFKILKDKSKWLAIMESQLSSTIFRYKQ
ncbi:23313_t:CDS:1, partial [Racocetra persica]